MFERGGVGDDTLKPLSLAPSWTGHYKMGMTEPPERHLKTLPVVALVVASMVGTGVFLSLGYQVRDIPSGPTLMLVWSIGGLLALCGALCYAELGSAIPRSGGEYHFISTLYHPSLGWTAGILSAIIGFAAPTAVASLLIGRYAHRAVESIPAPVISVVALLLITGGHLLTLRSSAVLQTVSTLLKLTLIVGFIIAAFAMPGAGGCALVGGSGGGSGDRPAAGVRHRPVVCLLRLHRLECGGVCSR